MSKMYELSHPDASVLTLGELKQFIEELSTKLPMQTPIMLNAELKDEPVVPCIQVLADDESVEFYNY